MPYRMEIWDRYFYSEEIPRVLSEIRGTCSRVAYWADKAGETDSIKFDRWKRLAAEHADPLWPDTCYMVSADIAEVTYASLQSILKLVSGEEDVYRDSIQFKE